MRLITWILVFCCCACVKTVTDILVCSEYLVSGFRGLSNSYLSASSFLFNQWDTLARNGRLYYPGQLDPLTLGGWMSATASTNEFLQVTFPVNTTITSITVQGRHSHFSQWVTSYYLKHSLDGVNWMTVTSTIGSPKLFNGSMDMNTPVTSQIEPNITTSHLRINPQSWEWLIALRFDVSGCQERKQRGGRGQFVRKAVSFPPDEMRNVVIPPTLSIRSMKDCAVLCHKSDTCFAFTYGTATGVYRCTGYSAWTIAPVQSTSETGVFVRQDVADAFDIYGYKDLETGVIYSIIEVKKTQAEASSNCITMFTRLMEIDTTTKMEKLQENITGYFVLEHDFRFYVAGIYSDNTWSYSGERTITATSYLWSPGQPDPSQGHCVMLTRTGLDSVDCQEQLFSICGN